MKKYIGTKIIEAEPAYHVVCKPRRTGADRDDETDEVRSGGGA